MAQSFPFKPHISLADNKIADDKIETPKQGKHFSFFCLKTAFFHNKLLVSQSQSVSCRNHFLKAKNGKNFDFGIYLWHEKSQICDSRVRLHCRKDG